MVILSTGSENFLSSAIQCFVLDGEKLKMVEVTLVPQGTILRPVLFLLFINDLPDNNDSTVRLFADDCEIRPSHL
jgi:hypothetical protein